MTHEKGIEGRERGRGQSGDRIDQELSEKLQLSLSLTDQPIHSTDEKIRLPERWLDNIREKEKEYKNLSSPKEGVGNNQKVTRN